MSPFAAGFFLLFAISVGVTWGAQAGIVCALVGIGFAIIHLAGVIEKIGKP